jgi:hypothetical protein
MRTPPLSLRNHQQAELEYLRAHRRSLLLSEVGTGKTPVLLRYALDFIDRGEQVVWLTETGLTRQLLVEARLWLPATAQPVQLHRAGPDTPFIVSSHHLIRSRIQQLEWLIPKAVIVDEAGVLGCGEDPHSPLYEAVSDMIGRADLSVLATATPVRTAHALDLFALMEAGGTPGTPFRSQIQREIRTEQAPTRYGHRSFPVSIRSAGLNLLTAALSQGAVRSTAADLCEPLPTVTSPTIEVPLTPSTLAAYRKAEDQRGLAGHQARQKLSRSLGPLVREVVDYVTTGPGRHHAHPVVFTEYHDLVRPIVSALSSLGWPVWTLTGNMTAAQRHRAITEHRQVESREVV